MVALLDAAQERIDDAADGRFTSGVEEVRAGTIFAHDGDAYRRWRARRPGRTRSASGSSGGLTGKALESAVLGLAARHPEYVVFGGT